MQPMPKAKFARPIVFTYLSLCMTLNCQNNSWGKFWDVSPAVVDPLAACRSAVAGDAFSMICVPANTTGFSRGWAGLAPNVHTVASISSFAMGKYEVIYTEWEAVRTWAVSNTYNFANVGQPGSSGANPTTHPAANMSWRDMIVWCNAASEKAGLTPIYYSDAAFTTVIKVSPAGNIAPDAGSKTAGAIDNPYVRWSANGFRLPTGAEWEYVARYINSTTFMRGDAPSGWQDSNGNTNVDAGERDAVGVVSGGSTQPTGTKSANALGLHDMSGNVFEVIWDWQDGNYTTSSPYTDADSQGSTAGTSNLREVRGGGYSGEFGTAARGSTGPHSPFGERGFRIVRRP